MVVRNIEVLNGTNDVRIEDFIKTVRLARTRTNYPLLLLKIIMAEMIINVAKQAKRYRQMKSYDDLYEALRSQLAIPTRVGSIRARVQNILQGATDGIQSYNGCTRKALIEIAYAVQAKHPNPTARNLDPHEE